MVSELDDVHRFDLFLEVSSSSYLYDRAIP